MIPKLRDGKEKDLCLRILARVFLEHDILPESCIEPEVVPGKKWKIGGIADIFKGRLGQEDVCIKVFRQREDVDHRRIKGVGRTWLWKNVALPCIISGVLLSRSAVEAHFAAPQRAPFSRSFGF